MTRGEGATSIAHAVELLKAAELARAGRPLPKGAPPVRKLLKVTNRGWLIAQRAAKIIDMDEGHLLEQARRSPALEVADAEPPRLFGLFKLRPRPAIRWASPDVLEEALGSDPEAVASAASAHAYLAARIAPVAARARSLAVPGKLRRPPRAQRVTVTVPSREVLLRATDPSLPATYAQEAAGQPRKRRPPRSPLRFSDGRPANDLTSALRLLVTAPADEVADRMRTGTLALWLREDAGEGELASVVEAAAHLAQERGASAHEARVLLLQYIRRTPIGADLERRLVEPMAEALRSRDAALVASTAEAFLLLDADLAAAELADALFETEVAGRAAVMAALGETGSPRAVSSLERLADASTRKEDREGALMALRRLANEGAATDVAAAAMERLGHAPVVDEE